MTQSPCPGGENAAPALRKCLSCGLTVGHHSQALNRYSLHDHSRLGLSGGARPVVLSLAMSQQSFNKAAEAYCEPDSGRAWYTKRNNKDYRLGSVALPGVLRSPRMCQPM